MSPNLDSPVQTQMAVAVFSSPLGREYHGNNRMEGKAAGTRRVFVQTESGCVLGMDLDRSDNAHTVKRRLQIALNVPVEESSLTFGDMVLKNDLSAIRKDSPLLLTRNLMHRSSSTPCLSPTGRDLQQRDRSGPIEILGHSKSFVKTKQLVEDVIKGMKIGVDPIPVHSGLGGAYYFRNSIGESVAIVKPTDEEPFAPNNPKGFVGKALGQPGLKRSVRVGETGFREVAAYLLDCDHFANVPPTALVKITHSIFNVNDGVNGNKPRSKKLVSKIASFQQFIPHDFDASDHGTSSFPVADVHRIGILDIRILNTDRHAGNLLVRKLDGVGRFGQVELIPIDHGLCLPETLEDPYYEWIHWPQASIPFSEDELEYIKKLDPARDSEMLRSELPMIREACLRVLVLCTIFLKESASFGLCLAEIGEMMSREFRGGEEEPSELEVVCIEARRLMAEREVLTPRAEAEDDGFQFDIDCEDAGFDFTSEEFLIRSPSHFGFGGGFGGRNPLSKLEESIEVKEPQGVTMANQTVKLLGAWGSPYSRRVEIALKLKGVKYEFVTQDLSNKSPLLLKNNPVHKKVPVLLHNGRPIAESLVIVEYIDETWKSGTPILPTDSYGKSMARFWAKFMDDKCLPAIYNITRCQGEEQEKAIEDAIELLKILEKELEGKKFFGGESIGLVDIAANVLGLWLGIYQEIMGIQVLTREKLPRLSEWADEYLNSTVIKQSLPPRAELSARLRSFFKPTK